MSTNIWDAKGRACFTLIDKFDLLKFVHRDVQRLQVQLIGSLSENSK